MTDDIDKKIKELTKSKLEEVEKNLKKESADKKKKEHNEKQKEKAFSEAYAFFKTLISILEIKETTLHGDKVTHVYVLSNPLRYIEDLVLTKKEFRLYVKNKLSPWNKNLYTRYEFSIDEHKKFSFLLKTTISEVDRELTRDKQKSLERKLHIARESYNRRMHSHGNASLRNPLSTSEPPSKTQINLIEQDLYKTYTEPKYFDSKNEFVDHAYSILTENMTDEEVMKYFKEL